MCVFCIFHHFESMCIGMFEFIHGQQIHIYQQVQVHAPTQSTSSLDPSLFSNGALSKMKRRKTKTPYRLNPENLLSFGTLLVPFIFYKFLASPKQKCLVRSTHTVPPPKTPLRKNNKHQTKKTVFSSTFIIYTAERNEELQGWR